MGVLNGAVGGARVARSGIYHGGWATTWLLRRPRQVPGPEVLSTGTVASTTLNFQALEMPLPAGYVIAFSNGVTATVGATPANVNATSVTVTGAVTVPAGEIGYARHPNATGGYQTLMPNGLWVVGWSNDAFQATPDRTAVAEAARAVMANQRSPYWQAADRANIVAVAGNGAGATWSTWTPPAGGQFIVPWNSTGAAARRFVGAVGGTPPTLTIKLSPAFHGGRVHLFFAAPAGTSKGGAATITASATFNGGTACTINTTSASTVENIRTGLTGTVNGTTTLTLTSGTFDNPGDIGSLVTGSGGSGAIAAGTKIASLTSSTVATLDTAGTANAGGGISVSLFGYVPMVKTLDFGGVAGAKTITVTLTGMDATNGTAEFIFLGYGIESPLVDPGLWVGVAKRPQYTSDWTDVDNMNADIAAVIAGTATNPNSGNSTEPAMPDTIFYDPNPSIGAGLDTSYWSPDGTHLSAKGDLTHALDIRRLLTRRFGPGDLIAR